MSRSKTKRSLYGTRQFSHVVWPYNQRADTRYHITLLRHGLNTKHFNAKLNTAVGMAQLLLKRMFPTPSLIPKREAVSIPALAPPIQRQVMLHTPSSALPAWHQPPPPQIWQAGLRSITNNSKINNICVRTVLEKQWVRRYGHLFTVEGAHYFFCVRVLLSCLQFIFSRYLWYKAAFPFVDSFQMERIIFLKALKRTLVVP